MERWSIRVGGAVRGNDPGPRARLNVGHPHGATAYFAYLDRWRSSGRFEGLEFR